MRALQGVPNISLVIIDEVEASLHPRAQRRLMNFLIKLSRLRRVQVIVSTHIPYVLEELPPEARVLLLPTSDGPNVLYGASPEFALTKLDEIVHPETFVYVEVRSAEVWLREIISRHGDGPTIMSRTRISRNQTSAERSSTYTKVSGCTISSSFVRANSGLAPDRNLAIPKLEAKAPALQVAAPQEHMDCASRLSLVGEQTTQFDQKVDKATLCSRMKRCFDLINYDK